MVLGMSAYSGKKGSKSGPKMDPLYQNRWVIPCLKSIKPWISWNPGFQNSGYPKIQDSGIPGYPQNPGFWPLFGPLLTAFGQMAKNTLQMPIKYPAPERPSKKVSKKGSKNPDFGQYPGSETPKSRILARNRPKTPISRYLAFLGVQKWTTFWPHFFIPRRSIPKT